MVHTCDLDITSGYHTDIYDAQGKLIDNCTKCWIRGFQGSYVII